MLLKSKLLLISRGREDSRAHRLAIAVVEYAWDRGAEVRVRRESSGWRQTWPAAAFDDKLPEVSTDDLEWADVTIVLADRSQVKALGEVGDRDRLNGPRLVS